MVQEWGTVHQLVFVVFYMIKNIPRILFSLGKSRRLLESSLRKSLIFVENTLRKSHNIGKESSKFVRDEMEFKRKITIEMQLWKESLRIKIDFVTQNNGEVILIEVKAKDGRTKAGTEVLTHKEKYKDVVKMIRLKDTNVGSFNNIDTFPAYMSFLVK